MPRRLSTRLLPAVSVLALALPLTGCDQLIELLGWELTPEEEQIKDLFTEKYLVKLAGEPADVVQTVTDIQEAVKLVSGYEYEPLHIFTTALAGFQVKLPLGAYELVKEDVRVEYIVIDPDQSLAPNPSRKPASVGAGNVPAAMARIGGPYTGTVSGIEVAVVDTGVDLDHPDLNVVGHKDLVAEAGGEDSGGDDLNGHGTHVAGTIGGKGSGVTGMVPGIGIHAVRVLDREGSGSLGDIIAGLEYVLTQPAIKVVNMSLGGAGDIAPPAPLKEAIDNLAARGVVVCIAAGNESVDTDGVIPAGYDSGIVVSAYDTDGGVFADFSNYGSAVDVAAPGVDISSTLPGGEYGALSGTSMATPHVAGAAAAYLSLHATASPAEVRSAIASTGEGGYAGQGGAHPEPLLNLTQLVQ